ncbi:MAG: S-layer protein [Candidatus Aenigmatarchaeota archaeon]
MAGTALVAGMTMAGAALAQNNVGEITKLVSVSDSTVSFPTIVVGANAASADVVGAIDVGVRLAAEAGQTKTAVGGAVSGVESQDIVFGVNVTSSGNLKEVIKHSSIPSVLTDSSVSWTNADGSDQYDFQEQIIIANSGDQMIKVTGTSGVDKEFKDKPFLQIANGGVRYNFTFDENINTTKISSTYPLTIKVLGKDLKITSVGTNQFTATIAEEKRFKQGESATVDGKTVTVNTIGSDSVDVSVDGVSDIATTTESTINGLKVKVKSILYQSQTPENSVVILQLGSDITKTYQNDDPYIGEDKNDPNWKWDLTGLTSGNAKHKISVKFVKNLDNYADNPPMVGTVFKFPNDYAQISFDKISPVTYARYKIEYTTGVDLSYGGGSSSATVLKLSTADTTDAFYVNTGSVNDYTKTIYLLSNSTLSTGNVYVYYVDSNNRVQYAGATGTDGDNFADLTYQDTTYDMKWYNTTNQLLLTETQTSPTAKSINITVKESSGTFTGLGATAATADATDFVYGTYELGTREEDVLTNTGAIIRSPKSNAENDRVYIDVPSEQVKGTITVGPVGATATTGGTTYKEAIPITSSVAKLDTEVSKTAKDLILVGGPCANSLVEELATAGKFPYSCKTWPTEKFAVVAVVKDAFTTGKTAVVIAGTTRTETRMGTDAVQQGLLAGKTDTKVKITSLTSTGITALA